MRFTIDRINGEFAVVITDNGQKFDIPCALFPDAKEGNIYSINLDETEMKNRYERIKNIADEIWE